MSYCSRLVTLTRVPVVAADDLDDAVDVADLGLALGHAAFEQLLDSRQAGGDVQAGDAAGVERPHRQLRARLADRLGGDDAHRLADADEHAGGQVAAVAQPADALAGLAGQRRADQDLVDPGLVERQGDGLADLLVALDDELARLRVGQIGGGEPADHALLVGALLVAGDLGRFGAGDPGAFLGAAVLLAGDHVLGHVHQAPGQVARVGGAQGGVRQALAGAVGGDEVLQNGHAFAEVAPHRHVDDPTRRVRHEAAHAAQLADLALVTSGARVGHHPHRAEAVQAVHHRRREVVGRLLPDLDDLLVALVVGDQAALELLVDLVDGGVGLGQAPGLSGGMTMSATAMVMPPRVAYSKPTS